jgi:hypothetical protein
MPAQFLPPRRGEHQSLRRLMIAVLDDAVRTYQKHHAADTRHGRALFNEAEAWLFDPGGVAGIRFDEICDLLDLEPDFVRRGLRAWRETVSGAGKSASASP